MDSPEKKNAGMYLFWFNYQIDGILLSAGEYDGIVPFARVWVTDEGVRRMEATPLVVTDRIRVSVMTPGEVIDKNRLNADPSDAEMGYACVRENGGLTAVPIWTNLEDKRYDVATGEPVGGAWG